MTDGTAGCPFCAIPAEQAVTSHGGAFAVRDIRPVSPGHTLLIPRRHVPDWWSLDPSDKRDLDQLLTLARAQIDEEFEPDGYNVGFNDGPIAGQTIRHVHVHLIPRYRGDVADPVDGLRKAFAEAGEAAGAGGD